MWNCSKWKYPFYKHGKVCNDRQWPGKHFLKGNFCYMDGTVSLWTFWPLYERQQKFTTSVGEGDRLPWSRNEMKMYKCRETIWKQGSHECVEKNMDLSAAKCKCLQRTLAHMKRWWTFKTLLLGMLSSTQNSHRRGSVVLN